MQNDINLDNVIDAISLRENTFTPEGGKPTKWYQLVLPITVGGQTIEMLVKITPDKALVLLAGSATTK